MNIQKGYKLVPVEITHEMLSALWSIMHSMGGPASQACYESMLAAAPAPPLPIYDEAQRAFEETFTLRHHELIAERDRLRAEIAGLKTGYEAYERVNAELKAENETLLGALKGMTSMYGHCWDLVDGGLLCMQDNVQRFEDAHEAAQKVIAALGQGEQS